VKLHCAKMIQRSTTSRALNVPKFLDAEGLCRAVLTSIQLISYSLESFAAKIVLSKDPRHWSSEARSVTLWIR